MAIKRSSARSVRSSKRAASPAKKQGASVKRKSAKATARAKPSMQRPIELFYWPTPNGWKISIMLEECRLPYVVRPVNIAAGEQFAAEFLAISPNNRMPAIVDPQGPGGRPISVFEFGCDFPVSRAQDREILSGQRARPGRGRAVADVANGRARPDGGAGPSLPQLCR